MKLCKFNKSAHARWVIPLILVSCILTGCVTNAKITYFQEYPESDYSDEYVVPETYKIQPNDNIYIRVSTLDSRFSAFFNVPFDQNNGGTIMSEATADLMSYPVQENGTIEMPYIGAVEVAGKNLSEATKAIEDLVKEYVNDAAITVRLVNNYVSVLGFVNMPGLYPIYKQRLNIFQAISMAGDLAIYGDRYQVIMVRQTLEGSEVKEFDLTDSNIVDSEYYYILPNDVIYVKPIKGRFLGMAEFPWTAVFASITSGISIILLINTLQQTP